MRYEGFTLYSDYDGTLTSRQDHLHPENVEAIAYFERNGGRFSLATGKTLSDYEKMPFAINAPAIFGNGAELFDPCAKVWLRRSMLPHSAVDLLRELFFGHADVGLNVHTADAVFCYRGCPALVNLDEAAWFHGFSDIAGVAAHDGAMTMITAFAEPGGIERVCGIVAERYPDLCATVSYPGFLNIMAAGTSKGAGLDYVRGTTWGEGQLFLAVGDGENDLGLLAQSDVSFAIGDSYPSLLMCADVVLEDCSRPCIPQIISYIDDVLLGSPRKTA